VNVSLLQIRRIIFTINHIKLRFQCLALTIPFWFYNYSCLMLGLVLLFGKVHLRVTLLIVKSTTQQEPKSQFQLKFVVLKLGCYIFYNTK